MNTTDLPIKIEGIPESFDKISKTFSELNIQETLIITSIEEMARILRVSAFIESCKVNASNTIKVIGIEGHSLTGSKLTVEGKILLKLGYVSKSETGSLYTEELNIPFCCYIIMEEDTAMDFNYNVSCHIEDLFVKLKSNRELFYSITIYIQIEPLLSIL